MQLPRRSLETLNLEQVIDRSILQVNHNTSVVDTIALMDRTDCVLVMEGLQLVGLLTASDIVKLVAARTDLSQLKISQVMTRQFVTLKQSQAQDIGTILSLFHQHQLRQLPIVDNVNRLVGIVSQNSLQQALQALAQLATGQSVELMEANQELQVVLEEMQAAEEELQQQNAELALAREALELEHQRYQDLFEFAPEGYLVTTVVGNIQQANQAAATLLNVSSKHLVGKPLILFIAQQDRMTFTTRLTQAQEIQDWEVNLQPRNGAPFPVAIAATEINNSQGQKIGWRWLLRDITDRRQMEQNLQAAHDNLERLVTERTADLSQANTRLQQEIREHQQAQRQIHFQANILTQINDAVIAIDNESCITYWNRAAEKLYGCKAEEILGQKLEASHRYVWLQPEDEQAAAAALAATGVWRGENIHIKNNGEQIYVESCVNVLKDDRGTNIGLLAVIRDISSRKQTETALQEREAMLRSLGDNLPNGFIYQVVRELDGNERCYYISRGIERETGFTPEEILANTCLLHDLIVEEDRQRMNRVMEESMHNLSIFNVQVRERSPQGELRWLHLCSAPRRLEDGRTIWDGVRLDITELKQAEAALYEREERLRLALTAARMGTWDWDILENDVTYSEEMRLIFGMPPEATHSTYDVFLNAIHPEDRTSVVSAVNSAFEGKTDYWMEYRVLGSDGNWRWVASKGQVLRDRHGKPARMVGVATDITEKKQLETQFLRIQRLENLGTLASGISHDINNILTPILVVAQLLQLKYPDSERREMLEMIVANAKRGADLVKQVVSFARGVEGNRQSVQVQSSVAEVVQIVKQTFPKSIAIETDIPSDLWTVTADATQLHQVLMNLCLNARDAMPDGGTLRITATNLQVDESYARMHIEAKVGLYVVIAIADTGCGIPPENLDRIFDPFFTTKETGKGTGLGLSTALGIVKSHDGFIDVSSHVGVGTQLQVYLPSSEGSPFDAAEDLELLSGRGELILVVDDESAIDAAIATTLTSHNYRVLAAQNGIEAIALYAQYQHEIDMVLIDMMMPEMDGTTAINALQRINPQVQIVAMSGMKSATAIAQATNSSIQGFLPKPFTAQELLKAIQQINRG